MSERPLKALRNSGDLAKWMAAQTRYPGFAEGVLNTLRNYGSTWQPEDYEALGRSGIPVLAVWGTADAVNPFEQSRTLSRLVPQTKIVPLEGKGHAITFGEAETVLATVIPFFEAASHR